MMNGLGPRSVLGIAVGCLLAAGPAAGQKPQVDYDAPWTRAHLGKPMTAQETKAFMRRLAAYVEDNHLKKAQGSAQRGMVYEYFDVRSKGLSAKKFDQWVQGEGLDTMHDGAWLAAAMVNAFRATGDDHYREFLTSWQMPFYCKMLNHSDELFTGKGAVARAGAKPWDKPWAFQEGEKGFVPYWWDDGASVSLERRQDKNPLPIRPSIDRTVGKPNRTSEETTTQSTQSREARRGNEKALLDGYSLGMSNHMAQDLGVMVQLAWLLLKDDPQAAGGKLAAEVADAAANLHACRVRHWGTIPMCVAPAALAKGDAGLMKRVPDPNDPGQWTPGNHYTQALRDFKPGQRMPLPGFADDQQYRYYFGLARAGGKLPRALAFKTVYDAYTEPMLYRCYCDDWAMPAGINRFDLYGEYLIDGRFVNYRSDRKGPFGLPTPIGSRMGPQNMICCGWAVQILRAMPGLWEEPYKTRFAKDLRVYVLDPAPGDTQSAPKPAEWALADGRVLKIHSTRGSLCVAGSGGTKPWSIRIYAGPDAPKPCAIVGVTPDGKITAINDCGQALKVNGVVSPGFVFHFELPYAVAKGQAPWANGIEHGRYGIEADGRKRNLYLASPDDQVAGWLRHELAGGLRTWEAVFRAKGFIPTGMGRGGDWDFFSDTGGYAHLLSAAAQWLLVLDGKCDWQVHNCPDVLGGT